MTPEEKVIALEAGMEMLKTETRKARDDRDAAIIENAQLKNRLNAYSSVLHEIRIKLSAEGGFDDWLKAQLAQVGIKGEDDGN